MIGIELISTPALERDKAGFQNVDLDDLTITGRDQNATFCSGGIGIRIRRNDIEAVQLLQTVSNTSSLGKTPLVFVRVGDVLIELNRIAGAAAQTRPSRRRRANRGGIASLAADNHQRVLPQRFVLAVSGKGK